MFRLKGDSAFAMTSVDSPDDIRHGEHTFRDVILVTLGFNMCSHCLSMLIPFFQAYRTTNTLRANRPSLSKPLSCEPIFEQNDLIPLCLTGKF